MEPNQSDLTGQTLSDAAQLTAADGATAAEQSLSLAELEATLGKKFPNKETALKAVKDTFNFVGAKQVAANPAPAEANADVMEKLKTLEGEMFYANNPQFKGHEAIIKAMGSNPAEVVGTDAFKTYFEKAKVADEVTSKKSVVSSNSRLGSASNYTDDAVKVANATHSANDVSAILAQGIVDELGLK